MSPHVALAQTVAPVAAPVPETIPELIDRIAAEEGIPAKTLYNLAWSESRLNPDAVGDGGKSLGLTQIHLGYWKGVTREQALDPEFNLRWAAQKIAADEAHLWTSCNCYSLVKTKTQLPRMAAIIPNSTLKVGNVAIFNYRGVKHIAYITAINGSTFTVQEANKTACLVGTRVIPITDPNLVGFWSNR